ncbi:MAG: hypothetical protein NVSMB31_01280 [Vulcanimicrobiaceae bacterium]
MANIPGRLRFILLAHAALIEVALQANNVMPYGVVKVGWPNESDLLKAAQGTGPPIVAIIPVPPSKNVTRSRSQIIQSTAASNPVIVQQRGMYTVFSGSMVAGLNVHIIVGSPPFEIFTQTTPQDALPAFVGRLAALINAQNSPGVRASAPGNVLQVSGGPIKVNIGGQSIARREVGRVDQRFQVTVFAPDDDLRDAMAEAIMQNIGTSQIPKVSLSDGTRAWTRFYSGPNWTDEPIATAMLKRADMLFMTEYANIRTTTLTQVGSFTLTSTTPRGSSVTVGG